MEILEFDVEEFVTNNEFDLIGNKFVALKAGYYQIDAQFTSESHDCKEVWVTYKSWGLMLFLCLKTYNFDRPVFTKRPFITFHNY